MVEKNGGYFPFVFEPDAKIKDGKAYVYDPFAIQDQNNPDAYVTKDNENSAYYPLEDILIDKQGLIYGLD